MKYIDLIELWLAGWQKISAKIKAGRAAGRDGLTDAEVDEIFAEYQSELDAAKAASATAEAEGR